MIQFEDKYKKFIKEKGVGENDNVADSIKSYISYLNSVERYCKIKIGPNTLSTDSDIEALFSQLSKAEKLSAKTIKNCGSAMRHYVSMIDELNLKNK
jgi:hypothetical protein